jgi:hypothetical protein
MKAHILVEAKKLLHPFQILAFWPKEKFLSLLGIELPISQ